MASQVQLQPSTTQTAQVSILGRGNGGSRGMQLILNVTQTTGGSLTLTILGYDPGSQTYYPMLVGNLITTTGTYVFRIDPLLQPVANLVAQDIVPPQWGVQVVPADNVNTWTYSLGVNLLDP